MYDLPRKFTYGVIENYALARGGEKQSDDSLLKYPGNQHSAEWYLFSDLNRPSSERVGSAVTRVLDPEEADLFYVPFFSSLSLVANPIRSSNVAVPVERPTYSDEETQVRNHHLLDYFLHDSCFLNCIVLLFELKFSSFFFG